MKLIISIYFSLVLLGVNAQLTQVETNTESDIFQISILDSSVVALGVSDYYGVSYDSCNNNMLTSVTPPGVPGNFNASLNRLNENTSYIISYWNGVTHFQIYKTINGGHDWDIVFDTTGMFITELIMFDELEGLAFSTYHKMFRTVDGGQTWNLESYPYTVIFEIRKIDSNKMCLGLMNYFVTSTDRGHTWSPGTVLPEKPVDFCFLSQDTILGVTYGTPGVKFCRSIDFGDNFTTVSLPSTIKPADIAFRNPANGFIVGKNPYNENKPALLKSDDFGDTWVQYDFDLNTEFTDLEFLNDSIALISGTNGVLLKYNYLNNYLDVPENLKKANFLNLSPNPTDGIQYLSVSGNADEVLSISLLDLSGKEIKMLYSGLNTGNIPLDLTSIQSGFYLLSIQVGLKVEILRVQKM
ncbi:MAG: T9SS type A sorting domain-containing protein [Bacteroidota bacterium]